MKKIIVLIISLCLCACGLNGSNNQVQKYGEKVSFEQGKVLTYPDFTIKYVGKRTKKYPDETSALTMTFYDFEVVKDGKKQMVIWTTGAGDIAPVYFYIDTLDFAIEHGKSEILKEPLGEGTMVIWKRADFEEALKKK